MAIKKKNEADVEKDLLVAGVKVGHACRRVALPAHLREESQRTYVT